MQSYTGDVALNVYDSTGSTSVYFTGIQEGNVFAWACLAPLLNKEAANPYCAKSYMDNTPPRHGGPNAPPTLPTLPRELLPVPRASFLPEPQDTHVDLVLKQASSNVAGLVPAAVSHSPEPFHPEPPSAGTSTVSPASAISGLGLFDPPSGFRKGLTVADLRPEDAPTKQRTYRTQGKTTPRGLLPLQAGPSGNAKRSRGDSDENSSPQPVKRLKTNESSHAPSPAGPAPAAGPSAAGPSTSAALVPEEDKVENKRLANKLAQQRSRARKQETLDTLRAEVEDLRLKVQQRDAEIALAIQKKAANDDSILRDREKEALLRTTLAEAEATRRRMEVHLQQVLGETVKLREQNETLSGILV